MADGHDVINLGRALLLATATAVAFAAASWLDLAGDGAVAPVAGGLLPAAVETAIHPPVPGPDPRVDSEADIDDAAADLARAMARFEEPPAAPFAALAAGEDGNGEPAEPHGYGDDRGLDVLWQGCEAGDGAACDRLFEDSPVGSDYERFGLTCGDRPLVLDCTAELTN